MIGLINYEVLAQVCQTVSFSIIQYDEDSLTNLCQANSDTKVNYKLMYPRHRLFFLTLCSSNSI